MIKYFSYFVWWAPDGVSCQQEALGNTYEYSIRAHTHILPSRKDYQSRPTRIEKHKNYEKKKTRTERRKCYSNEYIYIYFIVMSKYGRFCGPTRELFALSWWVLNGRASTVTFRRLYRQAHRLEFPNLKMQPAFQPAIVT